MKGYETKYSEEIGKAEKMYYCLIPVYEDKSDFMSSEVLEIVNNK